jgi:hypothetical protein
MPPACTVSNISVEEVNVPPSVYSILTSPSASTLTRSTK